MARLQADTVDKLISLLTLPVGVNADDDRPESMEADINRVSESLGWLVFEDSRWFDYDARRIEDTLDAWLDDDTASDFDLVASFAPAEFLIWVEQLVDGWRAAESGTIAADGHGDGGDHLLLGIANPHYAPDQIPGTEFYKYQDNEYLYAATADASADQWKALEDRYDDHAAATGSAVPDDGRLRGYPYGSSVLPGTEYYLLQGETYLYGHHEFGLPNEWQPYEYWQELANVEEATNGLADGFDALINHLQTELDAERPLKWEPSQIRKHQSSQRS